MNNVQRECDRLKEEILSKDVKIKWAQNKLKTESDAHKVNETVNEQMVKSEN